VSKYDTLRRELVRIEQLLSDHDNDGQAKYTMDVIRAIDDGNDVAISKSLTGIEFWGGSGSVDDVILQRIPWTPEFHTDVEAQAELRRLLGAVARESLALEIPMPPHPVARRHMLSAAGAGLQPCAVVFDRDETLVIDVPFNGDPERVEPAPNARELLDQLRAAGLPLAVVSNQSGIGRGFITREQVDAVNERVEALLGPFAGFFVCPHAPEDACECRKPKPKLILDAARELGVDPACCVVVGDRESDVEAARNAGAIPLKVEGPSGLAQAVETILYWTLESSSQ
jgi:histidinol-phosphate phosphatase family protein